MHKAPIGALARHCIELSLKAVLLNRGYTAEQVVDFRHNLNKLFNETRHAGLDWADLDTKAIAFYAQAVLEQAFPQLSTSLCVRRSRNSRVHRNGFSGVWASVGGTAVAQATS